MNIVKWFVKSSADPEKTARTVKGMLWGVVPVLILVGPIVGIDVPEGEWKTFIEAIANAAKASMGAVAAIMTLYGPGRKILRTITK